MMNLTQEEIALIEATRRESRQAKRESVQESGFGRGLTQIAESLELGIGMALQSNSPEVREHATKWAKYLTATHNGLDDVVSNAQLVKNISDALNSYGELDGSLTTFAEGVSLAIGEGGKSDEEFALEAEQSRSSFKEEEQGWIHRVNPTTGQTVYFNNLTGESTLDADEYHEAIQNESNRAFAQGELDGTNDEYILMDK